MNYIPHAYDDDVRGAILIVWAMIGVAVIARANRLSLPRVRFIRWVLRVIWFAFLSLVLYECYILQRQTVESAANQRARAEARRKQMLDDEGLPGPAYPKRNETVTGK